MSQPIQWHSAAAVPTAGATSALAHNVLGITWPVLFMWSVVLGAAIMTIGEARLHRGERMLKRLSCANRAVKIDEDLPLFFQEVFAREQYGPEVSTSLA